MRSPRAAVQGVSRLLIVSNRLPVTVRVDRKEVFVEPSSGGLATAMRGPHQRSDSLWIGWPGDVSRIVGEQRAALDQRLASMRVSPVHLTAHEVSRYYDGFSNGVLWPLFHYLIDKVRLDARRDWEVYREVNERFAAAVAEQYREGDVVWVHDYQLALVPQMLRARIPHARIGFFLHIPFPSSEMFRVLPWREAILRGLLGADLIGFHTASYRHNFAFSAARVIGLEPDVDAVVHDDRVVRLGVFPIGIDAQAFASAADKESVRREADEIRAGTAGRTLVLGVDRLDYTKGIPRRLLSLERFFEQQRERSKRLRYVQLAVPTRERVDAYAEFRRTVNELVGRINGQYGSVTGVPIHLLHRSVTHDQLVALYRAADVMLVTPLRDGMNLVAKEYVATRTDDTGVLILSEFAGAADELTEALLVNPYDPDAVAHALARAVSMPREEQQRRMRSLRRNVFENDVDRWAKSFLDALGASPGGLRGSLPPGVADDALAELRNAPMLDLFLDYDGTLVPIVARPDLVTVDEDLRTLLEALSARGGTEVHVVSGRGRDDLQRLFGSCPAVLHAEHGAWSRAKDGTWTPAVDPRAPWKEPARAILDGFAASTPGSLVEEKAMSLAWHYRLADPELASTRLRELRLSLVDLCRNHDLELLSGSKVLEIKRSGVNKGRIVGSARPMARVLAVGDDRTDENMFAAVPPSGCTIHVGNGSTRARFRLASSDAVRAMLRTFVA